MTKALTLLVVLAALLALPAPATATLVPTVQRDGWICDADVAADGTLVVDSNNCDAFYRLRGASHTRRHRVARW